jgi:hypothetical protein
MLSASRSAGRQHGTPRQLNHLAHSDRRLTWIHLVFLFAVSVTPFSTTLLAQFMAISDRAGSLSIGRARLSRRASVMSLKFTTYSLWGGRPRPRRTPGPARAKTLKAEADEGVVRGHCA